MKRSERDHILVTKNYDLIIITKIRRTLMTLLPPKTFGIYDIQSLEKTGELKPDIDTASAFYKLAVTKKGLFNPLIRALELDSQHAAADLLKELQETNNDTVNRMPEPQASGNQPQPSHQNQRAVPIESEPQPQLNDDNQGHHDNAIYAQRDLPQNLQVNSASRHQPVAVVAPTIVDSDSDNNEGYGLL